MRVYDCICEYRGLLVYEVCVCVCERSCVSVLCEGVYLCLLLQEIV